MREGEAMTELEIPAQTGLLIGGEWTGAADGRRIEVENPSRREVLAEVPRGGAEDVDRAVRAAAAALRRLARAAGARPWPAADAHRRRARGGSARSSRA